MQTSLTLAEHASQNLNVPHFLHRLVKILTDENNDIIEWCNGELLFISQPKCKLDMKLIHRFINEHRSYSHLQTKRIWSNLIKILQTFRIQILSSPVNILRLLQADGKNSRRDSPLFQH